MITLKNYSIGHGARMLLQGVNASFTSSSVTALLGRNGTGKSTLLRSIAGLGGSYHGEILIDGKNIKHLSANEMAKKIAYVSTTRPMMSSMTGYEAVSIGRAPHTGWAGRLRADDRKAVMKAMELTETTHLANRLIDSLSDGECQRVMLARAFAQDTPNLILDEPTSYLDLPSRFNLMELLGKVVKEENKCLIFSTHELDLALDSCSTAGVIDNKALKLFDTSKPNVKDEIYRIFGINTPSQIPE